MSRKLILEALILQDELQGLEKNLDAQKNNHAPPILCGILGGISMASSDTVNSSNIIEERVTIRVCHS